VSGSTDTPAERLARWTAADAAIGLAAEAEQLRSQLGERRSEADDLRARLAQLTNRVAQLESENADLRRRASRVPLTSFTRRAVRKARSVVANRRAR
jgi:chromosome segregation ATPase